MGITRASRIQAAEPGESVAWRPRRAAFVASLALHALIAFGVLLLPSRPPEPVDEFPPIEIVFYSPDQLQPVAADPIPDPAPEPLPVEPTELVTTAETDRIDPVPVRSRPEPVVAQTLVARTVDHALESDAADRSAPVRRREPVKPQRPVTPMVVRKMALGGFSRSTDPPDRAAERRQRSPLKTTFDAATSAADRDPTEHRSGTVAVAGFAAATEPSKSRRHVGVLKQGTFGGAVTTPPAPRSRKRPGAKLDAPLAILSKPTPVYTDEARERRIEGEVVLEVTFVFSGVLQVHRVVHGLGHGLDEAAIEAAKKIRFEPARKNGRPVDHRATVNVVFRLA